MAERIWICLMVLLIDRDNKSQPGFPLYRNKFSVIIVVSKLLLLLKRFGNDWLLLVVPELRPPNRI